MKFFRHETSVFEKEIGGVLLQVVDRGEQRELRFGNHIVQSARSRTAPDVLILDYTRAMMAGFLVAPHAAGILHFGLGGGSLPTFIHRNHPEARQQVVELNPGVIDIAYRYFDLPISPRLEVVSQEGAEFLAGAGGVYDLIFLDAFHADGAAPHLNDVTFFRMLRDRLSPRGWLVNNTWGSDKENLSRVRGNLGSVFPQLLSISVRADSNVIFLAGPQSESPTQTRLMRNARALSQRYPIDFEALLHRLRPLFAPAKGLSATSPASP